MVVSSIETRPHVGRRLDAFLAEWLGRSRSHAQELIRGGAVEVRGEKPGPSASCAYRLRTGDEIIVEELKAVPEPVEQEPGAEDIPLNIVFEDDWLLVINKQPGLVVHPAAGNYTGTLVNALKHHCGEQLARRGGAFRLGIVHRLDKDTSGLLVVAKTDIAHERVAKAFEARTVTKRYRALAWGQMRQRTGQCLGAIGRSPRDRKKMAVLTSSGRSARTDYRVLTQGKFGADVECTLHTGRTHQIRVHLGHLGNPIWGDLLYGRAHPVAGYLPERQMLHAAILAFPHPETGKEMSFEAKVPGDYEEALGKLG